MKKIICGLLALIMTAMCLPGFALAAEYCALPDIASANGYEYIYTPEKKTANLRNASYILAFQSGNSIAAYKTVLGDQGTIELDTKVAETDGKLSVSKNDLQTKLVKYFPNLPDSSYTTDEKQYETTDDSYQTNTSAPSDWAVNEINSAIASGLITGAVRSNYRAYITREQFCELVIKLYDKSDGSYPANIGKQFSDTSNTSVLKACGLGIVYGVSDTEFAPYDNITRQEICAMLVRAIGVIYPNIDLSDFQYHYFDDINSISSWAMDAVQFAYDNGIMQGVGSNQILPRGNTTCEQAVLLINRIYENRSMFKTKNAKDVIETLKHLEFDNDDELNSVSVSFSDNRNASGVKIKEIKPSSLIYSTTGIKGTGVNISCSDDFDKATITFDYKPEALGKTSPSDLSVAWYNTDLNRIEVLDSTVNAGNHTVSVETTHFSEYILVDSKEWYSIWQRGQTIVRKTDSSGNNTENFNVRLVVDCSGSMNGDRINRAKECTYAFIQKLSADDKFSLIRFSGSAKTIISPTEVKNADMDSVKNIVMSMTAGGGTNFDAALDECINSLDSGAEYNNIIVFLSDGESSVNDSRLEKLNDNNVRIASVALGGASGIDVMKKLSDSTSGQYVYAESSADLDAIYSAIQGSLIGVDATDSDGDGLPDMVEITGMKNRFGKIIRTDPNKYDTDGDGKSDGEEMGRLIETDRVTDMDKKHGINKNVYFEMVSNPLDGVDENDIPRDKTTNTSSVTLQAALTNMDEKGYFKLNIDANVTGSIAKNITIKLSSDNCVDKVLVIVLNSDGTENYPTESSQTSGSYWENITKNIGNLTAGHHTLTYDLYCSKTAQGEYCNKSHIINVEISGDNFDTIKYRAIPPKNEDKQIITPPTVKKQYTKEELEDKNNYFEINDNCYCYDEDVNIKCTLKFKPKGKLTCSGNVTIADKGVLDMIQGGYLIVNGNFKFNSSESHLGKLNLGTIEIHGNAEFVKNFYATQSNKVIFTGSGIHEINMWDKFDLWDTDQYFQDLEIDGNIFQVSFKETKTTVNGKFIFSDWSWLGNLFFGDELQIAKSNFQLTPIEEQLLRTSVMRAYVQYGERTNIWGSIDYLSVDKEDIEYTYTISNPKNKKKVQQQTIHLDSINASGLDIGKNLVFINVYYKGNLYVFSTSPDFSEEVYKYFKKEITKSIALKIANSFVDEYKSLVLGSISDFLPSDINDSYQMIKFLGDYKDLIETYAELNK